MMICNESSFEVYSLWLDLGNLPHFKVVFISLKLCHPKQRCAWFESFAKYRKFTFLLLIRPTGQKSPGNRCENIIKSWFLRFSNFWWWSTRTKLCPFQNTNKLYILLQCRLLYSPPPPPPKKGYKYATFYWKQSKHFTRYTNKTLTIT